MLSLKASFKEIQIVNYGKTGGFKENNTKKRRKQFKLTLEYVLGSGRDECFFEPLNKISTPYFSSKYQPVILM